MHKNDRASWKRSLVLVWLGEAFSVLTSSVLQMGLIWHVTLTTGSAGALSLVSLAGFLPMAVLGVFAGIIVDRSSTKRLMIGADLFIAGVSCTLAFGSAVGGLPVRAVAAVVFVRALGTTLHTPAFNALTPMLAPPEMLGRLAGIQQFMQSGSYILGNAIAAVLYPMFGLTAMVALDVAGAVIASVAVAISGVETPRVRRALGMIAASAWIGATGGFKHQGVSCVLAIALFGVTTLASGLLPASAFALFLAFTFAMGVSSPLYSSPQMALMQRKVDPDCLGRVFGLYGAVCSWAMSVGLIFSTLFADSIGVTRCFVLVGAAMIVLAALSWSIKSIRTIDQH